MVKSQFVIIILFNHVQHPVKPTVQPSESPEDFQSTFARPAKASPVASTRRLASQSNWRSAFRMEDVSLIYCKKHEFQFGSLDFKTDLAWFTLQNEYLMVVLPVSFYDLQIGLAKSLQVVKILQAIALLLGYKAWQVKVWKCLLFFQPSNLKTVLVFLSSWTWTKTIFAMLCWCFWLKHSEIWKKNTYLEHASAAWCLRSAAYVLYLVVVDGSNTQEQ